MDVRAGIGCHMWPDGAKYEGQWAYGVQHGRGRYIWADGACAAQQGRLWMRRPAMRGSTELARRARRRAARRA